MKNDFAVVTACTPDYLDKLHWTVPTWPIKPQFAGRRLYLFHHGFKKQSDIEFVKRYFPDTVFVDWKMDGVPQREMMLSAFVLGAAKVVTENNFVKLDADTFFLNSDDAFLSEDFDHDIVAHKWGYTKPAWWQDKMDALIAGKKWSGDKSQTGSRGCARIISWCCLHKTEFVRKCARVAEKLSAQGQTRLPIPSHDSYLWNMANGFFGSSWKSVNLKDRGVNHCSRLRSIREEICASDAAWNPFLSESLLKHIQLEITTLCNRACPNCDRNCGTAPSAEEMSVEQINRFVDEAIAAKHEFARIDIIGGEPTLHTRMPDVLEAIRRYKDVFKKCKIRLTTNGTGSKVKEVVATLPDWVHVRNSDKEHSSLPAFDAVNIAPVDCGVRSARACSIPWRCGFSLSRYGYFLCGAGASVARVFGLDIGIKTLTDATAEQLQSQRGQLCALCGHSRSSVQLASEQMTSKSWKKAFNAYKTHLPKLY